jgi:hypothetical protein
MVFQHQGQTGFDIGAYNGRSVWDRPVAPLGVLILQKFWNTALAVYALSFWRCHWNAGCGGKPDRDPACEHCQRYWWVDRPCRDSPCDWRKKCPGYHEM